jgi:hypothetical protein
MQLKQITDIQMRYIINNGYEYYECNMIENSLKQ